MGVEAWNLNLDGLHGGINNANMYLPICLQNTAVNFTGIVITKPKECLFFLHAAEKSLILCKKKIRSSKVHTQKS